ncbi:MAG TPA: hypothetical protein VIM38_12460 [Alphaproteobacteria bacterium]
MKNISTWIMGAAAAVMGLAALFVASRAGHGIGEYAGVGLFAFCVPFVFLLMKTSFDQEEKGH